MDTLYCGDNRDILPTLPADSVQLVVTSPPYNVKWSYADGGQGDDLPLPDYLAMLKGFIANCHRILQAGGVIAINVPPTIRQDEHRAFPIGGWVETHLVETGWLLREPIVWLKTYNGDVPFSNSTAIGGPTNLYLQPCHERIILASKADYFIRGHTWPSQGRYTDWTKDVWRLRPGKAAPGKPLAFPDELVTRLVLLYSRSGDVVLDPFAGTGTVGRIARSLGRTAWLIEREPTYWDALGGIINQGVMFTEVA